MKTILRGDKYLRVSNEDAEIMTKRFDTKYVPKTEWKKNVRDFNKVAKSAAVVDTEVSTAEPKSKKKNKKA